MHLCYDGAQNAIVSWAVLGASVLKQLAKQCLGLKAGYMMLSTLLCSCRQRRLRIEQQQCVSYLLALVQCLLHWTDCEDAIATSQGSFVAAWCIMSELMLA